tara:strand:- start:16233 stop:16745 length:513 start_codon:yes stop_codon:yes gene_type:complete
MTKVDIKNIDVIFIDFDGVLTNNKVIVNENGSESVVCSRSDGLAFKVLNLIKIPTYIFSSEKNRVVEARAKKIKVPVIQNINDKKKEILNFSKEKKFDLNKTIYIGNDLNDLEAMNLCFYKICPSDSHKLIKKISDFVLKSKGGEGVIRELVEDVLKIDFLKYMNQKDNV